MSITSFGVTLEPGDTIEFWASRSEETAWVAIQVAGAQCEIRMERPHVEALRDQIPGVLLGLGRAAADEAVCGQAEVAAERATDAATRALDRARVAEQAGAHELAASLRAAAAEATASATAVDAVVAAFVDATLHADAAADRLICATWRADAALGR
ncbi:MAG TPA: hypothetical protein VFV67_08690 [Actinophytocola sp.]|uniref:hypothetical protein n=1 Tax=Actinophytocola sp. TaxID=1872138 RepID=UPI002DBA8A5E|nr:hypothetical protein [Actinophytocola sp.]HEU5470717.1 hypothetical protein [Actinophytocola sp.]